MNTDAVKPRIDIYDPAKRSHWAQELGVSEAVLRAAVIRFGTNPAVVRACLGIKAA